MDSPHFFTLGYFVCTHKVVTLHSVEKFMGGVKYLWKALQLCACNKCYLFFISLAVCIHFTCAESQFTCKI